MIGACWLSQASRAAQVSGLSGIFIVSIPLAGAEMKSPARRLGREWVQVRPFKGTARPAAQCATCKKVETKSPAIAGLVAFHPISASWALQRRPALWDLFPDNSSQMA